MHGQNGSRKLITNPSSGHKVSPAERIRRRVCIKIHLKPKAELVSLNTYFQSAHLTYNLPE